MTLRHNGERRSAIAKYGKQKSTPAAPENRLGDGTDFRSAIANRHGLCSATVYGFRFS